MLLSTRLAFTKSCRLNFSMSGRSSIGDGGQSGKCESGRRTSDYCSWYDHGPGVGVAPPAPKRRQATGTVSLEFLPGEGRKLITLLHTFVLFIQSIGPVNFCMHNDRSWCRFRCRWSCLCWFRCRWSCLCC